MSRNRETVQKTLQTQACGHGVISVPPEADPKVACRLDTCPATELVVPRPLNPKLDLVPPGTLTKKVCDQH